MIDCVFTIDYEMYGNGEGSLRELVFEPAQRLMDLFQKWNVRFVTFVEAAEFELIEANGTDQAINAVKRQIRGLHGGGVEIGLHLHPQWYNARYEKGRWLLDYSEYNLCTLGRKRITEIVDRSLTYLRNVLGEPDFTPLSFRAGNWLFQPTATAAAVLAERGIKIDSSVFKGGLQRSYRLDYRRALRNDYYWPFENNANIPDPTGALLEIPTYTKMVPFWKMITTTRVGLQQKGGGGPVGRRQKLNRLLAFLRFWYPLKFDYCRMNTDEMVSMIDKAIQEDKNDPTLFKPLVAIGHTKDLVDFEAVESFLSYLNGKGIAISTFEGIYQKCQNPVRGHSSTLLRC